MLIAEPNFASLTISLPPSNESATSPCPRISGAPIRQSLAVTGSINQLGEIQPIGGVNFKVEGFFRLCADRGLDGSHGVIIPHANIVHLMLTREVRDAIESLKGFVGTSGVFSFSPTDHNGLGLDAFEMITVKGGKFVIYQPPAK